MYNSLLKVLAVHGEKLIRLSRVVKTGLNNVVLHPMNSIVNNVVEPSILLQLVETSCNNIDGSTTLSPTSCNNIDGSTTLLINNAVHGVQHNIVHSCIEQLATT